MIKEIDEFGFKTLGIKEKSEVLENFKISLCNTFPLAECVQISADSSFLLTGHQDGTIRKWDTVSVQKDLIVASHKFKILAICLNATHLISSGQDSKVKIWKLPNFNAIFSFDGTITTLTFQITSNCFFAGGEEGEIFKINQNSLKYSRFFKKELGNSITSLISLAAYQFLHVGCDDGKAFLVDSDLNVFGQMMIHAGSVSCACENDFKVFTGCSDTYVRVWRTETQELLNQVKTSAALFQNIQIYKTSLIITHLDKSLIFLDVESLSTINEVHLGENLKCSLVSKSQLFFTGTSRNLRVFNLETLTKGHILTGHKSNVVSIVLSRPPVLLASGGRDNTIRVWDLALGQQMKILYGHSSLVRFLCFAEENSKLVSVSDDKTMKIWDLQTETACNTLPVASVQTKISSNLTYRNKWIGLICNDNTYLLWRMDRLEKPQKISRKYLLLLRNRKKFRLF